MAKMSIYDVARELQVQPKELIEMLKSIGVSGKVPSSSIEDTAAQSLRQMVQNKNNPQPQAEEAPAPAAPSTTARLPASRIVNPPASAAACRGSRR